MKRPLIVVGLTLLTGFAFLPTTGVDAALAKPRTVDASTLKEQTAATRAALAWLQLVDGGHYEQSWVASADLLKQAVPQEKWRSLMENGRKTLGKVDTRTVVAQENKSSPPGLPKGEYLVVRYTTAFENRPEGRESVVLRWEDDQAAGRRWRVVNYTIE